MKKKNILFSWIAVCVLVFTANSCKMIDRANKNYEYLEYTKAISQYKKVVKRDSTDSQSWARLGDCYRLNNQTTEAEGCYRVAVQNPNTKSIYKLFYAQMLINNEKYAVAHKWIDDYIKEEPNDSRGTALESGINHIETFLADKDKYLVEKLSINTEESEYGPALYNDGIIFTSSRESDSWANRSHSWTGKRYYSVYHSKGAELNFETPTVFLKGIQTKYNNSSVCFNKNGEEMILTRNNIENGKVHTSSDSVVKLKLYSSFLKNGNWSDVVPFPYNSDQYSCAHPALSPDGSKLYFASDMPGSFGGMDIWVCNRRADGWGQPVNLGATVNSEGNEIFPTVFDNGTIYFSSNGHGGLGGLDIYSTTDNQNKYSPAINAGSPVNSSDDDFGFIWDSKNDIGYLSSNRFHQGYNDDIFAVTKNRMNLIGLVYDKETNMPLEQSKVRLLIEDTIEQTATVDINGNFKSIVNKNKKYKVIVEQTNYKSDTIELAASDFNTKGDSLLVKVPLQKNDLLISIAGRINNETTRDPVRGAKVMMINFTCNDTLWTVADADGQYVFNNIEPDSRVRVIVEGRYCTPNFTDTSTVGIKETKVIHLDIGLYCLSDKIVLNNIYYDLDKSNIRPDAAKELDKLAAIMIEYPQIEIELGAHTDSRASKEYNMRLSQKRAASAVNYLVSKGINRNRMISHGYGETALVNRCINEGEVKVYCTEEEHQLNRRTEIKILSWNFTASTE